MEGIVPAQSPPTPSPQRCERPWRVKNPAKRGDPDGPLRSWAPDLASYDKYLNGVVDADLSGEVIAQAMESVPVING